MTTSLDVSRKLNKVGIDLLLAVDSVAVGLGVSYCILGAFARVVVLGLRFGIDTGEATRDVDFGLMMDDWAQFDERFWIEEWTLRTPSRYFETCHSSTNERDD